MKQGISQKTESYIRSHTGLLVASKTYTRIRKALREYISYLGAMLFGIKYHPVIYVTSSDRKLTYINNSKVACSAIKSALWKRENKANEIPDDYSIHTIILPMTSNKIDITNIDSFIFTFARNPFERLVSLYINKFRSLKNIEIEGFYFHNYLNGIFSMNMSFDGFAKTVCRIPDIIADKHFCSQSETIFSRKDLKIDFIGKLENLPQDWEAMNQQAGTKMEIARYNSSEKYDYAIYYTKELVELVAKRYRDDITALGYEAEYRQLLKQVSARYKERQ